MLQSVSALNADIISSRLSVLWSGFVLWLHFSKYSASVNIGSSNGTDRLEKQLKHQPWRYLKDMMFRDVV